MYLFMGDTVYFKISGYKDCIAIGQGVGSLYLWEFVTAHPSLVKKMIFIQGTHPKALMQYMKTNWLQAFLLMWVIYLFIYFCLAYTCLCFGQWFAS